VALAQPRATTLVQIAEQAEFLFTPDDDLEVAPESWERLASTDRVGELLDAVAAHLASCEWTVEAIDLRPLLDPLGLKARKALPAVYAAVEGRHAGLPLFDSVHLLGRDRSLRRIAAARARLRSA
jgi:glutamyl-tRNA synthetase